MPSPERSATGAPIQPSPTSVTVQRVDLDRVVSRYIGETEKNLAGLFDRAQERGEVLLFDEADALFGRRTTVQDSHDRYANLEISALIEQLARERGVEVRWERRGRGRRRDRD